MRLCSCLLGVGVCLFVMVLLLGSLLGIGCVCVVLMLSLMWLLLMVGSVCRW